MPWNNLFQLLFSSQISPDDDDDFIPLLEIVDTLKDQVNHPTPLSPVVVKHFLPRDLAGFYRYEGSLTTPDCNEGIVWTIFTNTIPISEAQVSKTYLFKPVLNVEQILSS